MERRTRFPVLMALLAAGLALTLAVAACGGDEPAAAPQEPAVSAQPVAPAEPAMEEKPYYEGKTIRVIANFPPGGGADMHARLTARHLPRFIEGNPRTVVVSKVGVGGDVGRNYVYAIKPDGLTIGSFSGTDPMRQLLADSAQWEADKWGMLLSFRKSQLRGWYIRGDAPYANLNEAIGQGSVGGPRFTVAADTICSSVALRKRAITEWLDLPMDITFGLPGSRTNVMTHLERDDIDSQASTMWFTITRDRPGWMADGFVKGFAFPAGHASVAGPNAGPPHNGEVGSDGIPFVIDLLDDPNQKALYDIFASDYGPLFRVLVVPPGVDADVLKQLQDAAFAMANDPEFQKDYGRFFPGEQVTPTHGVDLSAASVDMADNLGPALEEAQKILPECTFNRPSS